MEEKEDNKDITKYFFVSYNFNSNEGNGSGRAYYSTSDNYFNSNNFDKWIKNNLSSVQNVTIINYKEICKEEYNYNIY